MKYSNGRSFFRSVPENTFSSLLRRVILEGENSFQHDVDVVIEVPEKGKAVQIGRFNQGREAEIFSSIR